MISILITENYACFMVYRFLIARRGFLIARSENEWLKTKKFQ